MDAGALQIDEGHTAERVYDSDEVKQLAEKAKLAAQIKKPNSTPGFTTTETKLAGGNTVEVTVQPSKPNAPLVKPPPILGKTVTVGKPVTVGLQNIKANVSTEQKVGNNISNNNNKPQKKRGRPAGSTNSDKGAASAKGASPKKKILLTKSPKNKANNSKTADSKKATPKKTNNSKKSTTPTATKSKKVLKEETPTRISDRSSTKVVYNELSDDEFDMAAYEKIAYESVPDEFIAKSPEKVKIPKNKNNKNSDEVTISKKEFDRLKSIEKKYQQIQKLCK